MYPVDDNDVAAVGNCNDTAAPLPTPRLLVMMMLLHAVEAAGVLRKVVL